MTTEQVTTKKKSTPAIPDKQAKPTKSEKYAKASLSPATMSAVLADSFTKSIFPDLEISDAANALRDKMTIIHEGDMKPIEAMLIGQTQALQTLFVSLGRKAAEQTQLTHYTAFMNLALKAQSQSRATIQALTELKYPKQATFVKQANISNGHQQVNNTSDTQTPPSRTKEITNQPNELLEQQYGAWLDTRKKEKTGGADPAMATVEKKYRGQDD